MFQLSYFQLTNVYSLHEQRRLPVAEVHHLAEKMDILDAQYEQEYINAIKEKIARICGEYYNSHEFVINSEWRGDFTTRNTLFEFESIKKE